MTKLIQNATAQAGAGSLLNTAKATKYEHAYGDFMQIAAESMKDKFEYDWTQDDTLAFGAYAENWEAYRPIMESDLTSRNTLGEALQSNLGLIAMAYASLPIQNLASVQPLNDEAGTVFFRKGVATETRGNVQAGDDLITPYGSVNKNIGDYTSETQTISVTITDDGGNPASAYEGEVGRELRPGALQIAVAGGKIKGMDDGEGHILGVGIDAEASTIDYKTGAFKIVLTDPSAKNIVAGDVMDITYRQSVIDSDTIPTMKWILTSKVVNSDYYILQSQYSNLSELVLRKRFGTDLSDQVSADLVSQITSGVMFKAIVKLREAAIRNEVASGTSLTWAMTAPTGVSDYDYRRTFDDTLIDATDLMYQLAGKGEVSTLVVGSKGKQILRTAGMKVIKNAVSGPHLCGMYDGIPVYYAPNSILGQSEILVVYRGSNWYEAPLVYAPFLPVTTVSGKAINNVLTNANAAYHAAALESVMDGFVARITLV